MIGQQNYQQRPVGNAIAPDLTDRTFAGYMDPVTSTGGLLVNFFYGRVQIKTRRAAYNGTYETRLFVAIKPIGDRLTIAHEPITEREAQARFPAEFAAFKHYQTSPTRGTPLMELPGISQSQIAMLTINGIRSIEDLLSLSPDILSQVGLEATTAFKIAEKWTKRRADLGDDVDLARQASALEIENRTLHDNIASMEAQMKAMQAQIDAMASMSSGGAVQTAPARQSVDDGDGFVGGNDVLFDGGSASDGDDDLVGQMADPLREG